MRNLFFALAVASVFYLSSCSNPSGNDRGTEYMPDMFHSIAYEANLDDYYYYNTWGTKEDYAKLAQPRKPVQGTIPRGLAGTKAASASSTINIPVNGSVPYYYGNTEEERARATAELINNPYPIVDEDMARAEELYDIFCGVCHGKKGDGNGYLVAEENKNAVYPAQPANFLTDEFVAASNGRYYHAIIHGKNVMGGYADKLSYEERWQVIHYIRSLQAKDKKLAYSSLENTLNTVDVPKANWKADPVAAVIEEVLHTDGDHGHGHEHDAGHHETDGHSHDEDHHHDGDHGEGH